MAKEQLRSRREGALSWREATAVSIAAFALPAANLIFGSSESDAPQISAYSNAAVTHSYDDLQDVYAAKRISQERVASDATTVQAERITRASRSAGKTAVAVCFKINPKKLHHTQPENYENIQLACELAKKEPWAKKDFTAQMNALVYDLWDPESGWDERADNPTSSAYGIPQALPGKKMGKGWQTSAEAQIKWGLGYITDRYGSPIEAVRIRETRGWY